MATNEKQNPKVRPISFKSANFDCLEHLEKQTNRSEYICQLIRLDMEYEILKNRDKIETLTKDNDVPEFPLFDF